jgi:ribosomal-protein-alanine N-acetyltransferase
MSVTHTIRTATADDLVALLKVEQACEQAPHWSEDSWRSMLMNMDGPRWHSVVVGTHEGVVSGFAGSAGVGDIAELESVAVLPAFRKQGLGRALCDAAMKDAAKRGAVSMELEVRAASLAPRKLYASLGFTEQGSRSGYYRDPTDDAVLMVVALVRPEDQPRKV